MSDAKPDEQQLTDEAIDLAIRLQSDPDNPVAIEMARNWRARGPDHERVWAKVARIHGATGQLLTERRKAERRQSLGLTRRNFMIGAVGLGAAGAGYLFVPGALLRARADHITGKGEIRQVGLPDGSVATLGPDSAVALDFRAAHRRVELLAGMSFFTVVRDAERPFSVRVSDLTVTALGTAFDVSSDADMLTVAVADGTVKAQAADSALAPGLALQSGDWVTVDGNARSVERGKRAISDIGSWRDSLIIADNETVSALVARVGRWIPGRVVMADPSIGSQLVSGIFDVRDPVHALEAVVQPAGGQVRRIASFLTVISPL